MEEHARHELIWKACHPIAEALSKGLYNYSSPQYNIEGPYIVLSNHVTDWDPILVSSSFTNQMYYVGSEHIMRAGLLSKLLNWAQKPITRQKGGSAAGAVKAILRAVKDGYNVALFPEGNRTWDGKTGIFTPSTGKLIRSSGCSLVTFRLSGGYFSSPRWSGSSIRKGKMTGEVVNIYTKDQLRAMTPAKINELIAKDLSEDAYARQAGESVVFKGKNIAEHLETFLFACPACGKMHRMKSSGDTITCTACGASARYTPLGYLEGGFGYENIGDWDQWQEEKLKELCSSAENGVIFADDEMELIKVRSARGGRRLGKGGMRLYRNRLELPGCVTIPLSDISGMSIRGASDLYIGTSGGVNYQVRTEAVRNTKKYLSACQFLGCPVEYGV